MDALLEGGNVCMLVILEGWKIGFTIIFFSATVDAPTSLLMCRSICNSKLIISFS